MKKVKIMLLSFALLAIVGGALAFKAKGNFNYCTTITNHAVSGDICTVQIGVKKPCDVIAAGKPGSTGDPIYCYTLDDQDVNFDCKNGSGVQLLCGTTTTLTTVD